MANAVMVRSIVGEGGNKNDLVGIVRGGGGNDIGGNGVRRRVAVEQYNRKRYVGTLKRSRKDLVMVRGGK